MTEAVVQTRLCQHCERPTTNPVKRDPEGRGYVRECDECAAWTLGGVADRQGDVAPVRHVPPLSVVSDIELPANARNSDSLGVDLYANGDKSSTRGPRSADSGVLDSGIQNPDDQDLDIEPWDDEPDWRRRRQRITKTAKVQERWNPTVATLVVDHLRARGGRVVDRRGFAAVRIREALGVEHSALRQALHKLEVLGFIRREVRGRRTFRIELDEERFGPNGDGDSDEELDAVRDGDPLVEEYVRALIAAVPANPNAELMDRIERLLGISAGRRSS